MSIPERIRIFVVDDHPMVRAGLAQMIDAEPDLQRVGDAADGAEAIREIPPATPDVVLVDLVMPRVDGVAVIAALRPQLPMTRFVVLTSMVDPEQVERAIRAGATGYLLKNASAHELVAVIRAAYAGRRTLAPEVTDALIAHRQQRPVGTDLTRRERELLSLIARGMDNQEIATALGITVPTVKYHVTNILSKLGVGNRTEAVLAALKHKLVAGP